MVCRGGVQSDPDVPHWPSPTFCSCQGSTCCKPPPKCPAAKGFGDPPGWVTPFFLFFISLIQTNPQSQL